MGHVRGHQLPIQNGIHNLRLSSSYENVPAWPGNEGIFHNNARNLTRKFQESFHATGGYTNGPASKRRRETNFNNAFNFSNGIPFARRFEDSACSSWGINNNIDFTGRREENSCNIAGFTSSSALARKAEDNICNSSGFGDEPVLRRVEDLMVQLAAALKAQIIICQGKRSRDALLQERMELTCKKKLILDILIALFFKHWACDCNCHRQQLQLQWFIATVFSFGDPMLLMTDL